MLMLVVLVAVAIFQPVMSYYYNVREAQIQESGKTCLYNGVLSKSPGLCYHSVLDCFN